ARLGDPPEENPLPVRITCALPQSLEEGVYDDGGLVVKRSNGVYYVWAVIGGLRKGQRGEGTFTNLPGAAPVAAYFCEWDRVGRGPLLGDARTVLVEVVRQPGQIQVSGYQSHGTHTCAVGLIVAGPIGEGLGQTAPADQAGGPGAEIVASAGRPA